MVGWHHRLYGHEFDLITVASLYGASLSRGFSFRGLPSPGASLSGGFSFWGLLFTGASHYGGFSLWGFSFQGLLFPGASLSGGGSGRFPGEGNSNPLQYSYLENSMDRGARQATVHGVAKNWIHGIFQARVLEWGAIAFSELLHCLVVKSCPTLCDPMDYSPPGSSVHGIL